MFYFSILCAPSPAPFSLHRMAPSLGQTDTPFKFDDETSSSSHIWFILTPIIVFAIVILVIRYAWIKSKAAPPPLTQTPPPTQLQGAAVPVQVVVVPSRLDVVEGFERTEVQATDEGTNDECFCLEEFVHGEAVVVPPCCRHRFHPSCLRTWIAMGSTGSRVCQFCKKDMGGGGGGGGGAAPLASGSGC